MLAGECCISDSEDTFITTHDFSTTRTHIYRVSEGRMVSPIWTHGKFLRFATVKSGCITILQVDFAFTHPPEVVKSLPAPDELTEREASAVYLFLPTISRLAITLEGTLLVWDARDSKRLLKISNSSSYGMSFSSDGRFFACALQHGVDKGIHIWKESSAGYILHRKLTFDNPKGCPLPRLSPNGESIILSGNSMIRLLHTEDPFLFSRPTLDMAQHSFILNLSPGDALAAFVGNPANVVTILDLQSGNPQLQIETGMEVRCLGVTESAIVVTNHEKIVTWKLDTRNTGANIHYSIRTTTLALPPYRRGGRFRSVSVSSDLSHIITLASDPVGYILEIYDVSTGRRLADSTSAEGALNCLLLMQIQVH